MTRAEAIAKLAGISEDLITVRQGLGLGGAKAKAIRSRTLERLAREVIEVETALRIGEAQ